MIGHSSTRGVLQTTREMLDIPSPPAYPSSAIRFTPFSASSDALGKDAQSTPILMATDLLVIYGVFLIIFSCNSSAVGGYRERGRRAMAKPMSALVL